MIYNTTEENMYNGYEINAGKDKACYIGYLDKTESLIKHAYNIQKISLFFRLDLRFPVSYNKNNHAEILKTFINSYVNSLTKKKLKPFYLWVREIKESSNPHFHFIFMLNGNKTISAHNHHKLATELWSLQFVKQQDLFMEQNDDEPCFVINDPNYHLVNWCNREEPHKFIGKYNNKEILEETLYWASYLAKTQGKTITKDYQSIGHSNIGNKHKDISLSQLIKGKKPPKISYSYRNNEDFQSLSEEQIGAFNKLESGHDNIFLTGNAGTGKSYVVKMWLKYTNLKVIRLAPTGLAADHIKGATIHNVFNIPTDIINLDVITSNMNNHTYVNLYDKDIILIDEISMVSSLIFKAMDIILRKVMDNDSFFGGKKVVVVGDFFQLPPVIKNDRIGIKIGKKFGGAYPFHTDSWSQAKFHSVNLQEVHRQNDKKFINFLNELRYASLTDNTWNNLSFAVSRNNYNAQTTVLCATRRETDKVNREFFRKLHTQQESFIARVDGEFRQTYPMPIKVTFKLDQKVMLTKNIYEDGELKLLNGTVGFVTDFDDNSVFIKIPTKGDDVFEIGYALWKEESYYPLEKVSKKGYEYLANKRLVNAEFEQIPLQAANAMTIHKSQGLTLGKVHIFTENILSANQFYVAFSRAKSFEDVSIQSLPRKNQLRLNKDVLDFSLNEGLIGKIPDSASFITPRR